MSDSVILHESRPFLPDVFIHRYGTPSLGYAFEKWLSPGTPRAYLQRLLSRQKLLAL